MKEIPTRELKKGSLAKKYQTSTEKKRILQRPFIRGGPKTGNPTMTTSTVKARIKGDPQHYVQVKKNTKKLHPFSARLLLGEHPSRGLLYQATKLRLPIHQT